MSESTIRREDAEEFSRSLAQIGEGWVRQVAWAFRRGMPQAEGLTPREWKRKYYGHLRIPTDGLAEVAGGMQSEGFTQREIADATGRSLGSVNEALHDPVQSRTEPDGDDLPASDDVETSVQNRTYDGDGGEHDGPIDGAEPESEPDSTSPAWINEGDEWYTPRWLFDALGIRFVLDVCAPLDLTHSSVPAGRHLTIEDDGLSRPWEGTVWCNPPYSKPEPWARRMIHHRDGLLLVHMPMNAAWCVDVWEACDGIRLFQAMEFVRPDGTSQRPGYWLQLAAFGPASTEALSRLQPFGDAAANKRRVASPMWRRAT